MGDAVTTITDRPPTDRSLFVTPGEQRYSGLISTPAGEMLLVGDGEALVELRLPSFGPFSSPSGTVKHGTSALQPAIEQLEAYFAGDLREFSLRLAPRGTEFQLAVWAALLTIDYGTTASYGDIARAVGRPRAFRAVGMANHVNPLAIVIPCHRVVGANGSLTGYGGGLELKSSLLRLEASVRSGETHRWS